MNVRGAWILCTILVKDIPPFAFCFGYLIRRNLVLFVIVCCIYNDEQTVAKGLWQTLDKRGHGFTFYLITIAEQLFYPVHSLWQH